MKNPMNEFLPNVLTNFVDMVDRLGDDLLDCKLTFDTFTANCGVSFVGTHKGQSVRMCCTHYKAEKYGFTARQTIRDIATSNYDMVIGVVGNVAIDTYQD